MSENFKIFNVFFLFLPYPMKYRKGKNFEKFGDLCK